MRLPRLALVEERESIVRIEVTQMEIRTPAELGTWTATCAGTPLPYRMQRTSILRLFIRNGVMTQKRSTDWSSKAAKGAERNKILGHENIGSSVASATTSFAAGYPTVLADYRT